MTDLANMSEGTQAHANCRRPQPPLTARQRQALDFIRAYVAAHGYPPALREIGTHMGGATWTAWALHQQENDPPGLAVSGGTVRHAISRAILLVEDCEANARARAWELYRERLALADRLDALARAEVGAETASIWPGPLCWDADSAAAVGRWLGAKDMVKGTADAPDPARLQPSPAG